MKIAACLIVKNEAPDIPEWLAYHAAAGFDAFLVFDNASSDGTFAALAAAASLLDVRIVSWGSTSHRAQIAAYEHVMRNNAHEFDWIAVFDSDEFIVTHGPHTLRSLCEGAADAAAIAINWAMFGSSGHVAMPNSLVIEAFTRRSEAGFPANHHVKSIVRPGTVSACINPHAFEVEGRVVLPSGQDLVWQPSEENPGQINVGLTAEPPDFAVAQVNHYFTRSQAHWARKLVRGYPNLLSRLKLDHFDHYDRNEIEDRSALWGVDAVMERRTAIVERVLSLARKPRRPGRHA